MPEQLPFYDGLIGLLPHAMRQIREPRYFDPNRPDARAAQQPGLATVRHSVPADAVARYWQAQSALDAVGVQPATGRSRHVPELSCDWRACLKTHRLDAAAPHQTL